MANKMSVNEVLAAVDDIRKQPGIDQLVEAESLLLTLRERLLSDYGPSNERQSLQDVQTVQFRAKCVVVARDGTPYCFDRDDNLFVWRGEHVFDKVTYIGPRHGNMRLYRDHWAHVAEGPTSAVRGEVNAMIRRGEVLMGELPI